MNHIYLIQSGDEDGYDDKLMLYKLILFLVGIIINILKLLLLLGRKVLEYHMTLCFCSVFGNIQWIIILLYLKLQRDEELL